MRSIVSRLVITRGSLRSRRSPLAVLQDTITIATTRSMSAIGPERRRTKVSPLVAIVMATRFMALLLVTMLRLAVVAGALSPLAETQALMVIMVWHWVIPVTPMAAATSPLVRMRERGLGPQPSVTSHPP